MLRKSDTLTIVNGEARESHTVPVTTDREYTMLDGADETLSRGYLRDDVARDRGEIGELIGEEFFQLPKFITASLQDGYCADNLFITPDELEAFLDSPGQNGPIDEACNEIEINLAEFLHFRQMGEEAYCMGAVCGEEGEESWEEIGHEYSEPKEDDEDLSFYNADDPAEDIPLITHGQVRCKAKKGKAHGKERQKRTAKATGMLPHYVYRQDPRKAMGHDLRSNFSHRRDGVKASRETKQVHMINMILEGRAQLGGNQSKDLFQYSY